MLFIKQQAEIRITPSAAMNMVVKTARKKPTIIYKYYTAQSTMSTIVYVPSKGSTPT